MSEKEVSMYDILGVDKSATKDAIKKSYRTLQMKYHPDKNCNNPESISMTQKINQAYEILGDDQKRREYDMQSDMTEQDIPLGDLLHMMFGRGNPFEPFRQPAQTAQRLFHPVHFNMNAGPSSSSSFPFGEIHVFREMNKPAPIVKTLEISMEQVLNGCSVPLEIERWLIENGLQMLEKETVYVDIFKGIDDNEIVVLRDKGNVLSDTCKGDVKVTIVVKNTTQFKRVGLDLILDKTISLKESLCGFTFELNYINGKNYTLNNNKGSIVPPEYRKIYAGMGLTRGENKGNMIICFHVDFPDKLTDEQIDILSNVFTPKTT
jgi:DnaJ-class molecular chaperone